MALHLPCEAKRHSSTAHQAPEQTCCACHGPGAFQPRTICTGQKISPPLASATLRWCICQSCRPSTAAAASGERLQPTPKTPAIPFFKSFSVERRRPLLSSVAKCFSDLHFPKSLWLSHRRQGVASMFGKRALPLMQGKVLWVQHACLIKIDPHSIQLLTIVQ